MHHHLVKLLDAVERGLAENEDWFRQPEEDMRAFEEEMHVWNKEFLQRIANFEKIMEEFEHKMD
ncbi:hypothetical protein EU245_11600 [Lentibacillus lipolyticus]|nr:hypothetical protein EU245_11600 [Lentibacillus lipolyticus]